MPEYHDPRLEHQMQVKMLGNSWIYVTCNCLIRASQSIRKRTERQNRPTKLQRAGAAQEHYASLGDFPVGTPIEQLLEVYNMHLDPTEKEWD